MPSSERSTASFRGTRPAWGRVDVDAVRGRAFVRYSRLVGSIPFVAGNDLLVEVQQVRRTASVLGIRATRGPLRRVAERALEHDDVETRVLAAQLLEELGRIPVLRP